MGEEVRTMKRLLVLSAGFLLCAFSLAARAQSKPDTAAQAATTTIRSTAQEVLLDMVFRDKKGRTIRDVRPEEVHISEDGVEQKVTSFRLVEGNGPPSPSEKPVALDPMREVRLVSLVFEGLDQDGKR